MNDLPLEIPPVPTVSRPHMPGYGLAESQDGLVSWQDVSQKMALARNYWVCTTRPDGRPHAAPVWGLWLNETFYFGTGHSSVKGRNLAHNPAISLHLESGDDVVILEGDVSPVTDPALLRLIYELYGQKYGMDMSASAEDAANPTYGLRPAAAFAWLEQDFPNTATRFIFPTNVVPVS
ncbi:MAG: pyridoxamine 5'-phosphate oxidase family protein [Chloroflexi bacterium]|nr:pyridoxamine 5'-phosphate oxidase family protein [Chloroflexota bacterium]